MSAIDISVKTTPESHPIDHLLRADRLPHILCPGCGIGTVIHSYAHAIANSGIPENEHVCVSGIGCSGRAAGYVNVDSYHATHGRALPFALGIAVHRPDKAPLIRIQWRRKDGATGRIAAFHSPT